MNASEVNKEKSLVSYVYDYRNGKKPVACVVGDESGIGVSVCHSKDVFKRGLARHIASNRRSRDVGKFANMTRRIVAEDNSVVCLGKEIDNAVKQMEIRRVKYYRIFSTIV